MIDQCHTGGTRETNHRDAYMIYGRPLEYMENKDSSLIHLGVSINAAAL